MAATSAGFALGTGAANQTEPSAPKVPGFIHRFAQVHSLRLHYYIGGTGSPLVLLHGWPQSSYAWRKVAPLLADRFQVIVPDLRGFGDTAKPETGYDTRTMAGDIRELVRSLGA